MKRPAGSKGQATVEMALVLPLLLWLVLGLVDIARMANAMLTVQYAAREGVRAGITGASDAEVEQIARNAGVSLEADRVTVVINPAGTRVTGTDLTVIVSYRYTFLAMMGLANTDVQLASQLTGRVE
ncbi:MAG: TadE/TadG family type IV pilus assembly protein [Bacillota bacterium]